MMAKAAAPYLHAQLQSTHRPAVNRATKEVIS
jgi:hypothetical protein